MLQDLSGQKLSQYQLIERLGRGGMAEVYKAYQPGMDRYVAVKVMLAHLADDEEFIERFKREAQAVGQLRHQNIVNVFDFGIENNIYFMVMEFIRGDNLKAYINQKGKLPYDEALNITAQIADALAYAHKSGMIHRDLKPANVMFEDDTHERAILTDFGVARIMSKAGLTASGTALGTPAYMSPEAGLGELTDERADLYALGVILYEMLTGNPPYDADTPMAIIMKHINAPLPTRDIYGIMPEAVERVILKSLAKDPNERFQTAQEMRMVVLKALDDMSAAEKNSIAAVPSATTRQNVAAPLTDDKTKIEKTPTSAPAASMGAAAAPRSRTAGVIIGLVVLAAIVVLAVVGYVLQTSRNRATPVAPAVVVSDAPQVAENTTDDLTEVEPQTAPVPPGERIVVPPFGVEGISPPRPDLNLNLLSGLSPMLDDVDTLLINGEIEEAETMLRDALAQDPENEEVLFANAMFYSGVYGTEAQDYANKIIELYPDSVLGHIALSDAYLTYPNYDTDAAREAILRADELGDGPEIMWRVGRFSEWDQETEIFSQAEQDGARGFRFINYAGTHLYYDDDFERAIPYLSVIQQMKDERVATYEALAALMGALIQADDPGAALEIAQRVAEGEPYASRFADIAYVAYVNEDYELAREWARKALALETGEPSARWILALLAYWSEGNLDAAMDSLDELEGEEFYPTYLHATFGHTLNLDRARILRDNGDLDEALEFYTREIEIDGWWPEMYEERASLYAEMDNIDAAVEDLRTALEIVPEAEEKQRILDMIVELQE